MRRIDTRRGMAMPRPYDEPAAAHERFKRLLGPRRREAVREAVGEAATATAGERIRPLPSTQGVDDEQQAPTPDDAAAQHDDPKDDAQSDTDGRDEPALSLFPLAASRFVPHAQFEAAAAHIGPTNIGPTNIGPTKAEALVAPQPPAPSPRWLNETLRLVGWLGSHAEVLQRRWSATVPLDALLAHSELQIDLSPHQLRLRFRAGSAESASLLSRHVAPLRAQLATLRGLPHDIDIDVE